jgi:hypothetical protein
MKQFLLSLDIPSILPVNWLSALAQGIHTAQMQANTIEVNSHTSAKFVPPSHIHTGAEGAQGGRYLVVWFLATSSVWNTDWEHSTTCWDPWAEPELKGTLYTFGSMDGLW